jgi:hypothetical protein
MVTVTDIFNNISNFINMIQMNSQISIIIFALLGLACMYLNKNLDGKLKNVSFNNTLDSLSFLGLIISMFGMVVSIALFANVKFSGIFIFITCLMVIFAVIAIVISVIFNFVIDLSKVLTKTPAIAIVPNENHHKTPVQIEFLKQMDEIRREKL